MYAVWPKRYGILRFVIGEEGGSVCRVLRCLPFLRVVVCRRAIGAGQQAQAYVRVAREQVPLAAEGDAHCSGPRQERRVQRGGNDRPRARVGV